MKCTNADSRVTALFCLLVKSLTYRALNLHLHVALIQSYASQDISRNTGHSRCRLASSIVIAHVVDCAA